MTPPPALRPPAWAEKYRWHWITPPQRDVAIPAMWDRSFWRMTNGINIDPFPAYAAGYRYSHPADPSACVIDHLNEELVNRMVDVLVSARHDRIECRETAHRIITALKEMP